jgi:hypothetical protein
MKRTDDELIKYKDDLIEHIKRILEKAGLTETCDISSDIIQKSKKKIMPVVYLVYNTMVKIEIELRRNDDDVYHWYIGQSSIAGKRMDFSGDYIYPITQERDTAQSALKSFYTLRIMRSI